MKNKWKIIAKTHQKIQKIQQIKKKTQKISKKFKLWKQNSTKNFHFFKFAKGPPCEIKLRQRVPPMLSKIGISKA